MHAAARSAILNSCRSMNGGANKIWLTGCLYRLFHFNLWLASLGWEIGRNRLRIGLGTTGIRWFLASLCRAGTAARRLSDPDTGQLLHEVALFDRLSLAMITPFAEGLHLWDDNLNVSREAVAGHVGEAMGSLHRFAARHPMPEFVEGTRPKANYVDGSQYLSKYDFAAPAIDLTGDHGPIRVHTALTAALAALRQYGASLPMHKTIGDRPGNTLVTQDGVTFIDCERVTYEHLDHEAVEALDFTRADIPASEKTNVVRSFCEGYSAGGGDLDCMKAALPLFQVSDARNDWNRVLLDDGREVSEHEARLGRLRQWAENPTSVRYERYMVVVDAIDTRGERGRPAIAEPAGAKWQQLLRASEEAQDSAREAASGRSRTAQLGRTSRRNDPREAPAVLPAQLEQPQRTLALPVASRTAAHSTQGRVVVQGGNAGDTEAPAVAGNPVRSVEKEERAAVSPGEAPMVLQGPVPGAAPPPETTALSQRPAPAPSEVTGPVVRESAAQPPGITR